MRVVRFAWIMAEIDDGNLYLFSDKSHAKHLITVLFSVYKLFMRNFQTLDAWKTAMLLVDKIFVITRGFPREEIFGLTSQIRRAAVSVPANIAEGMGRQYQKETLHFLHIARGSLYELDTLLRIATNAQILNELIFQELVSLIENDFKLLNGLINYIKKSNLK